MIFQITSALQFLIGGTQLGAGLMQQRRLGDRPEFEIDPEVEQMLRANLTTAQRQALEGLPAEQKRQYIENLQRSVQSGLRGLGTRRAGLAGVEALAQQEQDALRSLMGQDVAARRQAEASLAAGRQQFATQLQGLREKEFQVNLMQPFLESQARAQALQGAGLQNVMGAAQSQEQALASLVGGLG